jgi:hypothetical protein
MMRSAELSLGSAGSGPLELPRGSPLVAALYTKTLHRPGGRILSWLIQWIGQPPLSSSRSFGSDARACWSARADAVRTQ